MCKKFRRREQKMNDRQNNGLDAVARVRTVGVWKGLVKNSDTFGAV
jgi:hypothetical protein